MKDELLARVVAFLAATRESGHAEVTVVRDVLAACEVPLKEHDDRLRYIDVQLSRGDIEGLVTLGEILIAEAEPQ